MGSAIPCGIMFLFYFVRDDVFPLGVFIVALFTLLSPCILTLFSPCMSYSFNNSDVEPVFICGCYVICLMTLCVLLSDYASSYTKDDSDELMVAYGNHFHL